MLTWLRAPQRSSRRRPKPFSLNAERLEDRSVPSATLIKDLNVSTAGSDPGPATELDGRLYFYASDATHGSELWSLGSDGTAELVKDINPGPTGSMGHDLLLAGNRLFFTADDGLHGPELWTSDGTADGTHLVKDIDPTPPVETIPGWPVPANPQFLTVLNGGVAFLARDGVHGQELWVSDGTEVGTHLVKDINPTTGDLGSTTNGSGIMYFNFLQKAGNEVFFVADDGVHGVELWASDGSEAGTHLVKDLNTTPGITPGENAGSYPYFSTTLGGQLYFDATYGPGTNVDEAVGATFSTDGTADGTVAHSFWANGGAMLGDTPVFAGGDAVHGNELWAGDSMIKEIEPGEYGPGMPKGSEPSSFVEFHGALYFQARAGDHYQLWKTDGTAAGSVLVADLGATDPSGFLNPLTLAVVGDKLVINGKTGDGWQLWSSDGTTAGTTLLAHLADGNYGNSVYPTGLVGDTYYLLVSAEVGTPMAADHVTQLWATDGTLVGTRDLRDFHAPSTWSAASAVLGNSWYVALDDGIHGTEWWTTDGTVAGTHLAADINGATLDSSPANFVTIGANTYFTAKVAEGRLGVFKTDGTTEGTTQIADLPFTPAFWGQPPSPTDLTEFGDALFFEYDAKVWKVDADGASVFAGRGGAIAADGSAGSIGSAGDRFYFFVNGTTLWASDGTAAGSAPVHTFESNAYNIGGPVQIGERVGAGNTFFFVASDVAHGTELWKSDGTADGTTMVRDINPTTVDYPNYADPAATTVTVGNGSDIKGLKVLGTSVVFAANDGTHGQKLWISDGTEAGTTIVKDIFAGTQELAVPGAVVGGTLYFDAYDGEHGLEPWVSDGTEGGTHLLKDIQPKPDPSGDDPLGLGDGSFAMNFTAVGDTVYFAAYDSAHSLELWKTDGTEGGTVLVKDIVPGGGSVFASDPVEGGASIPHNLLAVGNTLYFLATDKYGTEIWMSDGTAEGTTLALDTAPGAKSGFEPFNFGQNELAAVGGKLVFAATDAEHGRELWGIDVAGLPETPLPLPDDGGDSTLPAGGRDDNPPPDDNNDDPPIETLGGVTVTAGADYVVTEGESVQFHADVAGRDDDAMLRYTWDIDNDGEFDDATGMNPTMVGNQLRALSLFGGPDSHTVRVRAEQRDGTEVGVGTAQLIMFDALMTTEGCDFEVTEGQTFNRNVATFKDPGGFEDVTHYSATIEWGDGTTSSGTVFRDGSQFRVSGEHAYGQNGNYDVTVAILDEGRPAPYATTHVTVRDAGLYANRTFVRPTAGRAFTGAVASFRDRNALANPAMYSATIDWGDGTTSDATLASTATGYDVVGTHTYAAAGDYLIRVAILDGAASTMVVSNAKVGAPAIVARGAASTAVKGQESSLTLATFRDADHAATADLFSASIDWTDGSMSAGLVEADGAGGFVVKGTHTFATTGTARPIVTIQDANGLSTQAMGRVSVTEV